MSHGFFAHNFPYTNEDDVQKHFQWYKIQLIRLFGTCDSTKIPLQNQVNILELNGLSGWLYELVHHTAHNEHTFRLCEMLCNEYAEEFKKFLTEGNIGFVFLHGDNIFIAPPINLESGPQTSISFAQLKTDKQWEHGEHDDICVYFEAGKLHLYQHLDIMKLQNLKIVKPAISLFNKANEKNNYVKLEDKDTNMKLLGGIAAIVGIPAAAVLASQDDNITKPIKKPSAKKTKSSRKPEQRYSYKDDSDIPFL
jgi:hypothetical protein